MIHHQFTIKGKGPRKSMQDHGKYGRVSRKAAAWFIVCDGMGGHPGGGEAARICSATLDRFLRQTIAEATTLQAPDLVRRGLVEVGEQLQIHILSNMGHLMMGTTICGILEFKGVLIAFWTGDSRIFQFRNNRCVWRSIPHNPVFDAYREGEISLAAAERTKTNILTKHIEGSQCFPYTEIQQLTVKPGDRFLLCTDGVWNAISPGYMAGLLSSVPISQAQRQLYTELLNKAADNFYLNVAFCS